MNGQIEHEGVVSRLDKGTAWITIVQSSACSDCHAQSACRISGQKEKIIEIPHVDNSFHEGDKVIVVGSASLGLLAVLYAFVIPLILVVALLVISFSYFHTESLAALISIAVLFTYFFVLYVFKSRFKRKFVFKIIPKFPEGDFDTA